MRGSAAQMAASFGTLSAAYANGAKQQLTSVKQASDEIVAIEKDQENARFQIALNGVKMNEALVKEEAQTSLIGHDQERADLLALEDEREAIERRHLETLQSAYAQGTAEYAAYQAKLEVLTSQSALRREQIELASNRQVYNDYRRTFEEIGSTVSSSIMGMIEGHENSAPSGAESVCSASFKISFRRAFAWWRIGRLASRRK